MISGKMEWDTEFTIKYKNVFDLTSDKVKLIPVVTRGQSLELVSDIHVSYCNQIITFLKVK